MSFYILLSPSSPFTKMKNSNDSWKSKFQNSALRTNYKAWLLFSMKFQIWVFKSAQNKIAKQEYPYGISHMGFGLFARSNFRFQMKEANYGNEFKKKSSISSECTSKIDFISLFVVIQGQFLVIFEFQNLQTRDQNI